MSIQITLIQWHHCQSLISLFLEYLIAWHVTLLVWPLPHQVCGDLKYPSRCWGRVPVSRDGRPLRQHPHPRYRGVPQPVRGAGVWLAPPIELRAVGAISAFIWFGFPMWLHCCFFLVKQIKRFFERWRVSWFQLGWQKLLLITATLYQIACN